MTVEQVEDEASAQSPAIASGDREALLVRLASPRAGHPAKPMASLGCSIL